MKRQIKEENDGNNEDIEIEQANRSLKLFQEICEPLNPKKMKKYQQEFDKHPENIIIRNSLVNVGLQASCTNWDLLNKVEHIFTNTLKGEHTKATDQYRTGRCWLFAFLNSLRHQLIHVFKLKNFEFSPTYLYFWDKFERSNLFMMEMIQSLDIELEDRYVQERFKSPVGEGGFFINAAFLIFKYGVVPFSAMPETLGSAICEDLNYCINKILRSVAYEFRQPKNKTNIEFIHRRKEETMKQIYNLLVKFLGKPPTKFDWISKTIDDSVVKIEDCTPAKFKKITYLGKETQYVVLGNYPNRTYMKYYELEKTSCAFGSPNQKFLNVNIRDMEKMCLKSILSGKSPWIAADVNHGLFQHKSVFDEKLLDFEPIFGKTHKLNKTERLRYCDSNPNHAMNILGVELSSTGSPIRWQIENSWGYLVPDETSLDGFYSMSSDWFIEHVYEIAVPIEILSKKMREAILQPTTIVGYYDPVKFNCDKK